MRDVADLLLEDIAKTRTKYRTISAVYFLFRKRQLVYIGQTLNLYSRIAEHGEKSWFKWDSYAFIEVHPEDLYSKERFYIKKFDPSCNRSLRSNNWKNLAARKRADKRKPQNAVDIEKIAEKMSQVREG